MVQRWQRRRGESALVQLVLYPNREFVHPGRLAECRVSLCKKTWKTLNTWETAELTELSGSSMIKIMTTGSQVIWTLCVRKL